MRSLDSDREMTAISAAAKKALIRIRTIRMISFGNNGSSGKMDNLLLKQRSV